jgi:hypothetical protein
MAAWLGEQGVTHAAMESTAGPHKRSSTSTTGTKRPPEAPNNKVCGKRGAVHKPPPVSWSTHSDTDWAAVVRHHR